MVPPGIVAFLKRKRASEEVVHVPKIIPRILKTQEEIVQVPKIIQQVVKEPIPMTQEEIATEPKIIQQVSIPKTQEEIVHEPKINQQLPMTQEEIVNVPTFFPFSERRTGRIFPFSPKTRELHRLCCLQVLPSERHEFID